MKQPTYHGVLVNKSFRVLSLPRECRPFAKKESKDSDWVLYGVIIQEDKLTSAISAIQQNMRDSEPWYAHLYNDEELIVIFKNKIFHATPSHATWKEAITYGKNMGIPIEQLDFRPNRFQDESEYFKKG